MTALSTEHLTALLAAGTAVISDVFDNLGLTPQVLDNSIRPLSEPGIPFAGPAYTVAGESARWSDGSGDRIKLEAIDRMTEGVVPVWSGGDIRGVCCFGDLLAEAMKARGCAGVVVDGGVRDTAYLRDMDLPIAARYLTPAQAIGRWRVTGYHEQIHVRGALADLILITPGDIVVSDADGVVVIPRARLDEFVEKAESWADKDTRARADIRSGAKLLDTLDKYGHL